MLGHFRRTICLLALGAGQSFAQGQGIEWNGFFTTGTSVTDAKVPYQNNVTKKPKFTDETLFGLNVGRNINDEWRMAAQILSRAGSADAAAKVDWAFITYKPDMAYDLTLGKQKIPMWITSSFRDVGRTYPWVNPPEEVYTVFTLRSFTGASFIYNLQIGSSTLSFNPYGGDAILEAAPNAPTATSKTVGTNMAGFSLDWVLDRFLLRAAYNRALWNINVSDTAQYGERRMEMLTFGLKVELAGVLLMSEYSATRDLAEDDYEDKGDILMAQAEDAKAAGDAAMAAKLKNQAQNYYRRFGGSKSYYATFGRQFGAFLPHLTYASLTRPFVNGMARDQDSLALGLNYDINAEAVVKVEAKQIHLPDQSQGLFTAPLDEDTAMVYRLSYSLIF